ncbi:hypothetical protein GLOTRDRAFT_41322, partial [Gloeophyllum trabeum ATCC 11539]
DDLDACPIPTLHAISAMGTKLCFYRHQNGVIEPPFIPGHPEVLLDTAPRERWDCDVLEEAGIERLRAVVEDIKQSCAGV